MIERGRSLSRISLYRARFYCKNENTHLFFSGECNTGAQSTKLQPPSKKSKKKNNNKHLEQSLSLKMKLSNYCYVSAFWAAFCVKRVAANHCDRGQSELHLDIDIRPDAYPDETLWTLVNTCSGTTLDEVSLTGAQPGQIVEYDRCVSSFSTYAFTIFDLEGDGILSSPVGGYKLTLDGTVIQDIPEGDFTFIENTIFGNGCDAPPNSDNTCPEGLAKFQVEVEIVSQ